MGEPGGVSVAGVDKAFDGVGVLHDVSLDVPAGTTLALLGPSGCGKTTLLRVVAGLENPDRGTVVVGGRDVTRVRPDQRGVGLVFQDGALFPHLTVRRNVGYGIGRREPGRDGRIDEALAMVGLTGLDERMPGTLSGGQQQRVALARALAPRPSVLLLDEPFSNLDAALRLSLRGEVAALLAGLRVTAVFVTHDQEEAFALGDRVAVLRAGRVEQVDTPESVYARPATPWVAGFVGEANLVRGRAEGATVTTALGPVPLLGPAVGPVEVLVRPESVRLTPGPGDRVERREFHGRDTTYALASGLRVRAADASLRPGDEVTPTYVGPPAPAWPIP